MKDITVFDKTYNKEKTENYRLSIQMSLDGFSFTTLDCISNSYNSFYYESLEKDIDNDQYLSRIENFLEKDFFAKPYKDVSIIFVEPKSTLIPASLFNLETLKSIFEFNHVLDEYSSLNYNGLCSSSIYCIYPVSSFVGTLLVNKFKSYKLYHQSVPLINDIVTNQKDSISNEKVFVNIEQGFVDIAVFKNKGLLMYNSYNYKVNSDIVYFIMNCYEQLKLDRRITPILLTGIYDIKSDLVETLVRYIANVEHEMMKRTYFQFEPIFKSVPVSRFPNLFKILQCE